MKKVVVVGTGPAGLTAAIYAARAGLKPVVYAGIQHGGQLTTTTEVENFPGFSDGIMGPELMNAMTAQAERVGAEIIYEEITRVDFSEQPLRLWAGDKEIVSRTCVIATGATAKTLGLKDEDRLMGRGVSTCATCDGFFYKDKKVMVIGGGDSAMEESLYLANLCKEVLLVHRRPEFRASNIMLERARKHPNIKFMLPWVAESLLSDQTGLTGVALKNPKSGEIKQVELDGLFYAIGHTPNSEIFRDFVDTDEHGYIRVQAYTGTRSRGVFAAGDIADPVFKQAVTAAGMGCQAAIQAAKFIEAWEDQEA